MDPWHYRPPEGSLGRAITLVSIVAGHTACCSWPWRWCPRPRAQKAPRAVAGPAGGDMLPREAEGLYTHQEWSEFIRQLNAAEEKVFFPIGEGARSCVIFCFRQ